VRIINIVRYLMTMCYPCYTYDHLKLRCLMAVLGMNAGNIGLVVITLERYFKVVHAIAHRKYYRKWMTKVGVAVPWISGFCLYPIPAYIWSIEVPGQCPRMMVLTEKSSRQVCAARTHMH